MSFTIEINPDDPRSVQRALNTEWLLTNGLGGYAMGTALGVNTRRYHGLLVAATKPPVGRVLALHSMIEQLVIPRADGTEEVIDLSTQQFAGPPPHHEPMLHPSGWRHLKIVSCHPNRRIEWLHQVGGITVKKSLAFIPNRNGVFIDYLIRGIEHRSRLHIRPFTPLRDFHGLIHERHALGSVTIVNDGYLKFQIDGDELHCFGPALRWNPVPQWWTGFAYQSDRLRGQDWHEDQWSAGSFNCELFQQKETRLAFTLLREPPGQTNMPDSPIGPQFAPTNDRERVADAARSFVVKRRIADDRWFASIIAGYPWFGDWGRDTMIGLPGLMLCTGRLEEAQSCLLLYAKHLRIGLIPNVFDDYGGAAHYNTVDASLWFVHAVRELWRNFPSPRGRGGIEPSLIEACCEIIAAYRKGTDFNIFMDEEGLISAGDEGSQLTWMDAKRDGVVFTPRHGKAVEINALWFSALKCMEEMSEDERERRDLSGLSRQAAEAFRQKFWWDERKCLHDVLIGRETASGKRAFVADGKMRPNQIFAVSLPFSPLEENQKRAVVKIVGERLLTPFGLRTLDRDDPNYRGRFEGNLFERDRAYHNGTVWPWLIGPYCEALLRMEKFSTAAKKRVRAILEPLLDEMEVKRVENGAFVGGCLGQLAEVYDGDPPHRPGGCPAQAWSVAEVLRIMTLISET